MQPVGYTGKLLDRYLANGWYRMGTRMFTCRYNYYPGGFLTTVWTRLALIEHKFPKRTAKVMRRNAAAGLRYEVHRARAHQAEERVFAAYTASKEYELHDNAAHYCTSDPEAPFDTWQVSVYSATDQLIAFSYFDIGRRSAQSVCGFYDPDCSKHSLGLYTLTLEVEHCKAAGLHHHYAGYLVPGNPVFEYKRKVGELEAYDDVRRSWFALAELNLHNLPGKTMSQAVRHYQHLYESLGIDYVGIMRPRYSIGVAQRDLQWLRHEALPFCFTDHRANGRPYWACHFYSHNFSRYFSMLCTSRLHERKGGEELPQPARPTTHPFKAQGVGVRLLHYSVEPYRYADLLKVWHAVEVANQYHRL